MRVYDIDASKLASKIVRHALCKGAKAFLQRGETYSSKEVFHGLRVRTSMIVPSPSTGLPATVRVAIYTSDLLMLAGGTMDLPSYPKLQRVAQRKGARHGR